jgi:hypothetical protein
MTNIQSNALGIRSTELEEDNAEESSKSSVLYSQLQKKENTLRPRRNIRQSKERGEMEGTEGGINSKRDKAGVK